MTRTSTKAIETFRRGKLWLGQAILLIASLFSLAAAANVLDVTVTGGGVVDDPSAPINCTSSGGPICQFDSQQVPTTVNLTATPQAGWLFAGWGGDCAFAGATPNCSILVDGNPTGPGGTVQPVTANFVPATFNLTVSLAGSGQGNVQSDAANPGIDCPADCSEAYPRDSLVTLTATPTLPTSVFTGWAGAGCTGTGPCNVPMNADQNVQATFENDADQDGVLDPADLCPNTPVGEAVDANGCSNSQLDDDGDGVPNGLDQCPNTPAGATVDARGCADSQNDSDGDGVTDDLDQCPGTPADTATDATGCSETQQFGNELGELVGLGEPQRLLGGRLDEICPQLVVEGDAGNLSDAQQDLREACSRLKNRATTETQAADALDQALLSQLPALHDYMVELTHSQFRHLRARLRERRGGGGSGASVAGLNVRVGGETVPSAALQSAFQGLLGTGASEEAFSDFGKLGLFLQGDIDDGDRDADNNETGYDFDSWNLTLGADYRFTDSFFAGGSISYGEVDVEYEADRGDTDVEQWALSLYAGWQLTDGWFLDGLLSYGESEFELERNVSYMDMGGDFNSRHSGDTDGDQLFVGLNTGYTFNSGGWRFGPVATVSYLDGTIDSYTESTLEGSEAWNFIVDERDIDSLRFSAGAQVDYIINTGFGVLIPGIRASYVIETEDEDEDIDVRLANNPFAEGTLSSDSIVVQVEARDDAFFDASFNLSAQFPMGVSGFFSYNFYSSYDNFSKDAYTIGLRWDQPF